jgi:hypothetical protein
MTTNNKPATIFVSASEVAACIGRNPYKARSDALLAAFKKFDPSGYQKSEQTFERDRVEAVLAKEPAFKDLLATAERATTDRKDAAENAQKLTAALKALDLTDRERKELANHVRSTFNAAMGTQQESVVLADVRAYIGQDAHKDDRLHKKTMGTVEGIPWILGGRVDGQTKSGDIVEIKNRTRRLFHHVPDYERVQVLCYCHLLDAQKAYLIEKTENDRAVHTIEFDADEFEQIRNDLEAFVRELVAMHHKKMPGF